ncbi:hypothetical protein DVA86_27275 [Streptomyces armeniacus]|uniref:Uncharacterized protein n=1 Tax=Streptomyces armeniacus TaxID=83291 RepID=A0A345XVW6_9ACTN|nr:hypothetical protein [Streptomyces armeniacus]AXK35782.1 hypothetical protein DVA86_27275 [Streptomyces armeniacus]
MTEASKHTTAENVAALMELQDRVQPGTRLHVINHDYSADGGTREVTRTYVTPDQTYRHEGRTHVVRTGGPTFESREIGGARREFRYQWPLEGDDFQVSGNTLRIFKPYHAYAGDRAIILTMTFECGE